ncbi:restriction endonuclease subunit S [Bacteroides thetaiotaomicron]|uniref:restriction endonuclease subunit S n=2 Tax=Bacteroides thetaiotaomicron TaxID=818 RepID=UPI001F356449|nr:restriction endonuclease subunit S [Bacteroides thetaiotaomicron]MCE8477033.1 restriction endonuclease subunit S [Bacteroides thetaiotaomicron]
MDTKALRQKILDLAIHGKLVPQDPNDEPASVLLERIKAEKERLIKEGKIKRSKKSAKTSDTPHYQNVPFEVPDNWVWCKLEDIAYVASGSTPDKTCFVENGIPYIKMYNLRNQKIDFAYHPQYITEEVHNGKLLRSRTEVGDLIMNIVGPPLGKLAIIPSTLPQANFNQAAVLIRPYKFKEVLVPYLKAYLEEMSEINSIATRGSAGQVNISLTQSQNMRIPLPPLKEIERIINEIVKYDILIEALESDTTDLQTLIIRTKSKILDLAIHGKLVPQDPNDEPAIELLKRINPDFTPCDNGHYTQLLNGWTVAPMQVLCSLVDGDKQKGIERINLDVKYLRGERDAKTLTSGKYVTANSLLILVDGENSGEVFRTSIDGYQGSTFKQLLINENMNEEYVLQAINLHRKVLRESKVGSAIPHLNKKLFKAIEIPIPPYKEQQRIIKAITKAFMSLDLIMESL